LLIADDGCHCRADLLPAMILITWWCCLLPYADMLSSCWYAADIYAVDAHYAIITPLITRWYAFIIDFFARFLLISFRWCWLLPCWRRRHISYIDDADDCMLIRWYMPLITPLAALSLRHYYAMLPLLLALSSLLRFLMLLPLIWCLHIAYYCHFHIFAFLFASFSFHILTPLIIYATLMLWCCCRFLFFFHYYFLSLSLLSSFLRQLLCFHYYYYAIFDFTTIRCRCQYCLICYITFIDLPHHYLLLRWLRLMPFLLRRWHWSLPLIYYCYCWLRLADFHYYAIFRRYYCWYFLSPFSLIMLSPLRYFAIDFAIFWQRWLITVDYFWWLSIIYDTLLLLSYDDCHYWGCQPQPLIITLLLMADDGWWYLRWLFFSLLMAIIYRHFILRFIDDSWWWDGCHYIACWCRQAPRHAALMLCCHSFRYFAPRRWFPTVWPPDLLFRWCHYAATLPLIFMSYMLILILILLLLILILTFLSYWLLRHWLLRHWCLWYCCFIAGFRYAISRYVCRHFL